MSPSRRVLFALIGVFSLTVSAAGCGGTDEPVATSREHSTTREAPTTRQVMASKLAKIQEGMSESEVLSILPKPDDVIASGELKQFQGSSIGKFFGFGVRRHLDFPIFGQIAFDNHGKVFQVDGGIGHPPDSKVISETELADLLRVVHLGPPFDNRKYDPAAVIRIVNTLQPLGKEKALAAIAEYLRVASWRSEAREGAFLVLRVLFEIPEDPGYMPEMSVGGAHPARLKKSKECPRFPIAIVEDIPLFLVSWYELGGEGQGAEDHVEYFRKHGRIRSSQLHPTDRPLDVLDKYEASPEWIFVAKNVSSQRETSDAEMHKQGRSILIQELLNMIAPVYEVPIKDEWGSRIDLNEDVEAEWAKIRNEVAKLRIEWDPAKNEYRRAK